MKGAHADARLLEILVLEDNPADIRYMAEVFKDARLANRVTALRDGDSALRYLRGEGEYAGSPRPDLVLLDLNLPGTDGRQVLAAIRRDPLLRTLPVIVLTTSTLAEDVSRSYDMRADSYMTKPVDMPQLIRAVMCLDGIGLALVAQRPPAEPPAR